MWSFNILSIVLAVALPLGYLFDYKVVASGSHMKTSPSQDMLPVIAMCLLAIVGFLVGGFL